MSDQRGRQRSKCPIFGSSPANLPLNQLSTGEEILSCFRLIKKNFESIPESEKKSNKFLLIIAQQVRQQLVSIWNRANVPTISAKKIDEKIRKLYTDYRQLKNNYILHLNGKRVRPNVVAKVDQFKAECKMMLDISCKREYFMVGDSLRCKCDGCLELRDQSFLDDQMTDRVRFIGEINSKETRQAAITETRKTEDERILKRQLEREAKRQQELEPIVFDSDSDESSNDNTDDPNYSPIKRRRNCSQNRLDLKPVAAVLLRHRGQPFTASIAAKCVNTTLQVVNVVDENKRQNITDSSKLRRTANTFLDKVQHKNPVNNIAWQGLYFDGKRDVIWGSRARVEQLTLLGEPGGQYIDHLPIPERIKEGPNKDDRWVTLNVKIYFVYKYFYF